MATARITDSRPSNGTGPAGELGPCRFIDGVLHVDGNDTFDTQQWPTLVAYAHRHGYAVEYLTDPNEDQPTGTHQVIDAGRVASVPR